MFPFGYRLICVTSETTFMCVRYPGTQACDLQRWYLGNAFLIVSKPCYTGRSQITGQLLRSCGHTEWEKNIKWKDERM